MNIGQFKNVNGMLLGSVATAALNLPRLGMKPVQSDNPRAPAYEIVALNPGKVWVQVGAVWEATSGQGEVFYQGRIDDPSMSEPLPIALFRNDGADGVQAFAVAWSRPQRRERDGFGGTGERSKPRQDDGFGTGNATESGQLANAGDIDDQIPF